MKNRNLSFLLLLPLLVGCASGVKPELEDYIQTIGIDDINNFTILSMQDIHLSSLTNIERQFDYFEKTIYAKALQANDWEHKEDYAPKLIVLNGDVFMQTNKTVVNKFFEWLDGLDIPFCYTYGNHDLQGAYSSLYIDSVAKSCKNSMLLNPKDEVFGDANYVVNVKDAANHKWQIYVFDSNNYKGFEYDVVHDDQIEWFKNETDLAKENNGGTYVPNLAFMHIPFEEFVEAWNDPDICGEYAGQFGGHIDKQGHAWYMGEGVSNGYAENDLYEEMQKRNTKGVIVGHDHINNTDWHYNKDGNGEIRLIYAEKTGDGIYHDPRIMGGAFFTLKDDGTFVMERVGVNYTDKYDSSTLYAIDDSYLGALPFEAH